ncbi:hypothetical protein DY000_02021776 [Brassica cretica]|uniref:Uncharacterized protein n=1 Tax=Brassica cretica TaxID=69181 RepID=A0ABQ7E5Y3_BRACR|nr:hypothetical protein DY000_02021776 [Brassica cretica]
MKSVMNDMNKGMSDMRVNVAQLEKELDKAEKAHRFKLTKEQPHLFDAETAVTHVVILTGINVPQAETFSLQKRNTLATVDRRNNR